MHKASLLVELNDKIAKIIIKRPDKKNAMTRLLHKDKTAALETLRHGNDGMVFLMGGGT